MFPHRHFDEHDTRRGTSNSVELYHQRALQENHRHGVDAIYKTSNSKILETFLEAPPSDRASVIDRVLSRIHHLAGAHKYPGWRFGVFLGLWTSSLVLFTNTVLLVWGAVRGGRGSSIGILAQGSSESTSAISTAFHVLINVLATILLSASNYCMQVLCAPTREEIDNAHQRGVSLDIGLQSFGNLRFVSRERAIVWWLLLLSSFPLHLFYNSSISDVTTGRDYYIRFGRSSDLDFMEQFQSMKNNTVASVLSVYDTTYVPDHGDLYLLVDAISLPVVWNHFNGSFARYDASSTSGVYGRYDSINMSPEMYDFVKFSPELYNAVKLNFSSFSSVGWSPRMLVSPALDQTWRSCISADQQGWVMTNMAMTNSGVGYHVARAAGERVDNGSKVQIALPFMAVVIASNLTKLIAMWYILRKMERNVLVTTGDAIQSFLQRPDLLTIGHCLSSEQELKRSIAPLRSQSRASTNSRRTLVQKSKQNPRTQWDRSNKLIPICLLTFCWTAAPLLVVLAFMPHSDQYSRWKWGPASQMTAGGLSRFDAAGILYNTWLANMPQVLLSSVYFFLNRYLTRYSSSLEWIHWTKHRKHLRVSRPQGDQRSTHFLQLPYKIGIPMMIYSGLLHWLLSQALFLRRLELRDISGVIDADASTCTVGFSPVSVLALVLLTIVGTCYISIQTWMYKPTSNIPYGANNSLVISAACHPPPGDVDACLEPLQWGVIPSSRNALWIVQHCTFTSKEVSEVVTGEEYA